MMKKNSIIEMSAKYISPAFMTMEVRFEGILCESDTEVDFGGGGYEPDPDYPGGIC